MPKVGAISHCKEPKLDGLRSLDTEVTGVDLHHGATPYLVSVCHNDENSWWEWDVDPTNRKVQLDGSVQDIQELVDSGCHFVLQNPKFDVAALACIGIKCWPWHRTWDTLMAGHLLASNRPHDLTGMCLDYLGLDLDPLESDVEQSTKEARTWAKSNRPDWQIAKKGLSEMPSAKEKVWKYDMWLPRAIALEENYEAGHPWHTYCSDYCNGDSSSTLALFLVMIKMLKDRGLWAIYLERLKLLPVVYQMEATGITLNRNRQILLSKDYRKESKVLEAKCENIAKVLDYQLILPKAGVNNSLRNFVPVLLSEEQLLELPLTGTGMPSLNKEALEHLIATLPRNSVQLAFVKALRNKRRRDTAVQYMEGYERFWLPIADLSSEWARLHPSLNPTGTHTLRFSSSNPNEQNISKQEGFNLRYLFGPVPGREWWSLDGQNLELRLPAYEAGETEMIDLFEQPDKPPYFGSYHLLVFDTLHPDKFAKHGKACKDKYASTWYQWTKNGNFSVQYGAIPESGTADRAYHVPGAQLKVQQRFTKIDALNQKQIAIANRQGYVETMPDKTVDPTRGYPILCTRTDYGRILETVPLNYHIQGTAMWWMSKAMVRCQEYLNELTSRFKQPYLMVMQVHDELVFDLPYKANAGNLPYIRQIAKLMEQGGKDIGVPTPVAIKYHPNNWAEDAPYKVAA